MLRVGLTGNIASGKSSVARVWRSLGGTVVDADQLARRAVEPGTPVLRAIEQRWGPGVLTPEGELDRAALRDIVFRDPSERARLEAVVHPAVAALREDHFRAASAAGAEVVVADIPLLFEAGLEDQFDLVVLVDAPEPVRRERLVRDRGLSQQEAQRMIDAQMPAARKRDKADVVIANEGTLGQLEQRAAEAWAEIRRRVAEVTP